MWYSRVVLLLLLLFTYVFWVFVLVTPGPKHLNLSSIRFRILRCSILLCNLVVGVSWEASGAHPRPAPDRRYWRDHSFSLSPFLFPLFPFSLSFSLLYPTNHSFGLPFSFSFFFPCAHFHNLLLYWFCIYFISNLLFVWLCYSVKIYVC